MGQTVLFSPEAQKIFDSDNVENNSCVINKFDQFLKIKQYQ